MQHMMVAIGVALALISCNKAGDAKPAGEASTMMDVAYGNDSRQKLDIYLPANRSANSTKLLLIIHGGGWSAGDKADFNGYIGELQKRLPDYAFANMNYRLVTGSYNKFPTQEADMAAAVQFLESKTREYGISNQFIFLGVSAGAHIAMLQAYKHTSDIRPKAVISFFGPVDLVDLYTNPTDSIMPVVLKAITGFSLQQNAGIYRESSPINYVTAQAPPTLMLHGTADRLVPIRQANMLNDKLQSLGVTHELVVYEGEGHGWTGGNLTHSFDKIEAFLSRNIN